MELGLHIADFTWDGGPTDLGPALAAHAKNAEDAGITRVTVMDHLWQISGVGPAEHAMLEAYTTLGFLAAHTTTVRLHTLVTGVIYREPALLAKAISTLDVLSGGRAGLGIGAGWNVEEAEGLGFGFPTTAERFERLEQAIQICLQMWSDSEAPYDGRHYRLGRTLNSPQPLQPRPYLLVGGGGEKRTLRLVAQYADACNIAATPDAGHKLDVLKRHCEAVGRDYAQIEKTAMMAIDPTSGKDDIVRTASAMQDVGYTALYVYARDITQPAAVIDLLTSAFARDQLTRTGRFRPGARSRAGRRGQPGRRDAARRLLRDAYAGLQQPFVSGMDISGTIDELASDLDPHLRLTIGQYVATVVDNHGSYGGYSQYLCLPAASILPVPRGGELPGRGGVPDERADRPQHPGRATLPAGSTVLSPVPPARWVPTPSPWPPTTECVWLRSPPRATRLSCAPSAARS